MSRSKLHPIITTLILIATVFSCITAIQIPNNWQAYQYEKTIALVRGNLAGTQIENCTLYDMSNDTTKASLKDEVLQHTGEIQMVCFGEMRKFMSKCDELNAGTKSSSVRKSRSIWDDVDNEFSKLPEELESVKEKLAEIPGELKDLALNEKEAIASLSRKRVKGTLWCGPGTDAASYSELGSASEIDRCCRMHDNCPVQVLAGQTLYNMTNSRDSTISHCQCDSDFYDCLQNHNTEDDKYLAELVGYAYFKIGSVPCFSVQPVPKGRDDKYLNSPECRMEKNVSQKQWPVNWKHFGIGLKDYFD